MTTRTRVKRPPKVLWVVFDRDGYLLYDGAWKSRSDAVLFCAVKDKRSPLGAPRRIVRYLIAPAHAPTKARK